MGLFDRLFGRKKEEPAIEEIVKEALESLEESETSAEEPLLSESSAMSLAEAEEKSADSQEENVIPILETSEAPEGLPEEAVPSSEEFYSELEERLAEDRVLNEVLADKAKVLTDEAEAVTEDKELTEAAPQPEESVAQLQEQTDAEYTKPVETEEKPKPTPSVMESYYAEVQQRIAEAAAHNQEIEEKSEAVTQEAPEPQKTETATSAPESVQDKYDRSLKKTRTGFGARLNAFFANFRSVDEEFFEELEELLITSDVGVQVASNLTEDLRYEARLENAKKPDALRRVIIEKLVDIYEKDGRFNEKINFQNGLTVMLFVGVNGVGKTTTIGKLASKFKKEGKSVLLAAGDTFRAAAEEQLEIWSKRADVDIVRHKESGSDPSAVIFDAMQKAKSKNIVGMANMLRDVYNYDIPKTREELETLPGVGRKTANVVLAVGFNVPAIAVDTHVERVAKMFGLADKKDNPLQVEKKLMSIFPMESWGRIHHQLIHLGRYKLPARGDKIIDPELEKLLI